jgi:hypothetical protein
LGVPLGYQADGRSAFSRAVEARRGVDVTTRDFAERVRISGRSWHARRARVVRRRLRQFGWGDWHTLFTSFGPNRDLLGREVGAARSTGGPRATLLLRRSFRNVRRASGVIPTQVAGRIEGSAPGRVRAIAVAVNGRIAAVGRSFHLRGQKNAEWYSVMVPEDSLREGRNEVEVLEVTDDGAMVLLARS